MYSIISKMANKSKLRRESRANERALATAHLKDSSDDSTKWVITGFVLLILLVGGSLWFLSTSSLFPWNKAAPLVTVNSPVGGRQHVPQDTPINWPHKPPSSGSHYPNALAWGPYQSEQKVGNWLHNLEHGGVVLVYRCSGSTCQDLYSQALAVYQQLPKDSLFNEVKFISTPDNDMKPNFAVLSWGKESDSNNISASDITKFYLANVDHGPEQLQ
jgi:hypothetical protein